jgi:hypothetical protein
MKILPIVLALLITATAVNAAELKSDGWKSKLESCIQQYDTTGTVIVEKGTYVYRYHTQIYKVHPITNKVGDISENTYDQEGPKEDGILLQVTVREGVYQGQLKIPYELKAPFWKTFYNAYPITEDKYLWLSLSYGSRSDKQFIEDLKNCFSTKKPRFGLYLITKDANELNKIELDSTPLITETDIINYNWTNHTMYITETAANRIPAIQQVGVNGKPFVIVADGKRAYRGAFWTSISSVPYPSPVIVKDFSSEPKTTIKIERRYGPRIPSGGPEEGPDPRDNESIKKVLQELGKLTEK